MEGVQSRRAVAVIGASSDNLYPNYIHAIATQGGGQYYAASNIDQLVAALLNILNSIQAVDSVFASSSLPIAVNAQGTYRNQVFVGMFRPDSMARPRWYGNLKQYQILYDPATQALDLGDSQGNPALNAATGFFRPSAISYWTTASQFWINDLKGTPKSASDLPDGDVVEKGGVAEQLRIAYATAQSSRTVLTCISCTNGTILTQSSSEQFADANTAITTTMLGAANATERTNIINWVRGTDNEGDEAGPGGTTTIRPSIHGDVLHSRPAVVDYGGTIGTIVFYGGNDGMLHAIDGNQTTGSPGGELWSFIPSEVFGRFKRLRDDLPEIKFPSTAAGANATPRDYFVDGSVTVYQRLDVNKVTCGRNIRDDASRRTLPVRVRRHPSFGAQDAVAQIELLDLRARPDVVGSACYHGTRLFQPGPGDGRGLRRHRGRRDTHGEYDDGQCDRGARRARRVAGQDAPHRSLGAGRRRVSRLGLRWLHRSCIRGRRGRKHLPHRFRDSRGRNIV
jgi:hypothetical protein